MSKEHFDINRVQISGDVQKIWDWDDDIFFKLAFREEEDGNPRYVTMRLAGGMIGGELVSLQPDDAVTVTGYLADSPHTETLSHFLESANRSNYLQEVSDPEEWKRVRIKRVATRVNVTELRLNGSRLKDHSAKLNVSTMLNKVQIQGVCVRAWKGGKDRFARLAVYDEHTKIIGHNPKKGLPRRKPHYITVRFIDGAVDGKPIRPQKKGRMRVSGSIHINFYRQSLHNVLLRTHKTKLLEGIAIDAVRAIGAVRTSLYVIAESAITYGSRG
ncbi:MAG: hypothetical protein U9Q82_07190 [Chloroflexota bacterium]|nr:hypothetical protein [Chloroflexota bacterium]